MFVKSVPYQLENITHGAQRSPGIFNLVYLADRQLRNPKSNWYTTIKSVMPQLNAKKDLATGEHK